ncbi:MAG TPA: response regulator transcription factor [Bacteroidales bacterium]|nr:response regulator transcription factor [Bacteroidales bacterium]
MKTIKIVLADDHQIFRDGIKALLSDEQHIEVIAEASNGEELLSLLKVVKPDVLVLDISMPRISGIELAKTISEAYPEIRILILSMHKNNDFVINAMINGAKGYLPKDTSRKELLDAINTIYHGDEYLGKLISTNILKSYIGRTHSGNESFKDEQLTLREKDIIRLVGQGLANKEIADRLFISIRTVDSHKNHIMNKLKIKSTAELIIYGIKNKIIDIQ